MFSFSSCFFLLLSVVLWLHPSSLLSYESVGLPTSLCPAFSFASPCFSSFKSLSLISSQDGPKAPSCLTLLQSCCNWNMLRRLCGRSLPHSFSTFSSLNLWILKKMSTTSPTRKHTHSLCLVQRGKTNYSHWEFHVGTAQWNSQWVLKRKLVKMYNKPSATSMPSTLFIYSMITWMSYFMYFQIRCVNTLLNVNSKCIIKM